jgi:2-iminoacetate synthase
LQQKSGCEKATEQFTINDHRPVAEVAAMLRAHHLDPVWKDWDEALLADA